MTRNGSDQMDQIYLILIRPSFNGILVSFYDPQIRN